MKRIFLLFVLLVVGLGFWFYLNKNTRPSMLTTSVDKQTNQHTLQETNFEETVSNVSVAVEQPTNSLEQGEPINALTATNLEQWKAIIPRLHYSSDFGKLQTWDMWKTNLTTGIPVLLEQNGRMISYKVQFINISVKSGTEDIMEVEIHSPTMNIDETRKLGLQLCDMLQVDPKGFLAWCDKVGNNWLDQPSFADGNRHYSFHLMQSFDKERPWYINFMIIPNP